MVDFKNLVKKKASLDFTNLLKLYESLDRQATHTDLRESQIECLEKVTLIRKQKDIILKVSTGAGKTIVGLLYLKSHMEESQKPTVYLCPTVQLVNQVLDEAEKLGIKAVAYKKGESHPDIQGASGKAIIVCTYDKLFNAKTTFERTDVNLRPAAMVLDDAHSGIEEIRDSFCLKITDQLLKDEILSLFQGYIEKEEPATWIGIERDDPDVFYEIPYWLWQEKCLEVISLIENRVEDYKFVWPYLKDKLHLCRCVIGASGLEISPEIPFLYKVPAFVECSHKLYMTATLADDSILVKELGCDVSSATNPIIPSADRGLGERMVLAPTLISKKMDRDWIMKYCSVMARHFKVVVLSPSEKLARDWEKFGAIVVLGESVADAVTDLKKKQSDSNFYVLVQRYDGVDLPDQACRILVIDGIPYGDGIIDKYDSAKMSSTGSYRNKLIYRIEQGMGRAVRSHVDYAVVLLSGADVAYYIAKHDVQEAMNPDSRAQLQLALKLIEIARSESGEKDTEEAEALRVSSFKDMVKKCLTRDEDWKQFYNEEVRNIERQKDQVNIVDFSCAEVEWTAFNLAIDKRYNDAFGVISEFLNKTTIKDREAAILYQKMAGYLYNVDKGRALEIQTTAYSKNRSLLCPPTGIIKKIKIDSDTKSSSRILKYFNEFANANGIIAEIANLRTKFDFNAKAERIEQALLELSCLLGAEGSRPEKEIGSGPDGLWVFESLAFVLEAKSQNEATLHKKDAGQLHISSKWFVDNYPSRNFHRIIVADTNKADKLEHFPENTVVMLRKHIDLLLNNIENFYTSLSAEKPIFRTESKIQELQSKFKISPSQIVSNYTIKLVQSK